MTYHRPYLVTTAARGHRSTHRHRPTLALKRKRIMTPHMEHQMTTQADLVELRRRVADRGELRHAAHVEAVLNGDAA